MLKKIKVMAVFGTRPEAIKMAPVILELRKFPAEFETTVAVTAQHREMLDQVLALFRIQPDFDLNIMLAGQTLFDITSRALLGLNKILAEVQPDIVLVHGDTTTTFTGALAAFYHQISVGHVEAGLRTGNKFSPFPEEINRKLTSALADLNFAPTETARENLLREGVDAEKIFVTGNTVIDALKQTVRADFTFAEEFMNRLGGRVIVVTTHRRENLGEPMRNVYRALKKILADFPDAEIIFPVHKNPKVRELVNAELGNIAQVHLIEPLDYEPFANLMSRATLILTDSGGVQEEAPALGKPVLVLRETTERPEAVLAGTVKLVGTDTEKIYGTAKLLLTDERAYQQMANAVNPYGDGKAARRIVQALRWRYGFVDQPPETFSAK